MNGYDKTGGPAFPGGVNSVYTDIDTGCPTQEGMTLRDYFAAKAMQGMLSNPGLVSDGKFHEENFSAAYEAADVMLAARNNQ